MTGAVAVLGVAPGSGKTVVTCGLLRGLQRAGVRVLPFKLSNAVGESEDASATQLHHRAAALADGGIYPLSLDADNRKARVSLRGIPLGDVPCLAEDTPLFDELPEASLALIAAELDRAAGLRPRTWIIAEGSGAVADSALDLPNTTVATALDAEVVLVANVQRGGHVSAFCGVFENLQTSLRERCIGGVLTNVPDHIDLPRLLADVNSRVPFPVLYSVPHVLGWRRDDPQGTPGVTYDLIADHLGPLIHKILARP